MARTFEARPVRALTKWRASFDGTLADAANRLGVERSTVLRWETGERRIPAERVREVSYVTGLAPSVLRPDIFGRV